MTASATGAAHVTYSDDYPLLRIRYPTWHSGLVHRHPRALTVVLTRNTAYDGSSPVADLAGANLSHADFSEYTGTALTYANLSGANLTGADLLGFNFTGASPALLRGKPGCNDGPGRGRRVRRPGRRLTRPLVRYRACCPGRITAGDRPCDDVPSALAGGFEDGTPGLDVPCKRVPLTPRPGGG